MINFDDAAALFEQSKDPFYLAAFMLQCWLGELIHRAAAEYAEKKNPKDRALQSGEAWRSLSEFFNLSAGPEMPSAECRVSSATSDLCSPISGSFLLSHFCRFAASDNSPGNLLRRSLVALSIEHYSSDPPSDLRSSPSDSSLPSPFSPLRLLARWCDWLDAVIHLQTHRRWHLSPACFDPDPEKRHLAALGNAQRNLAKLSDRARACWLSDFLTAAAAFKDSPKWATVGKAMSAESDRLWQYAEIDTLVIALWPLVTAHNWTYRDLLNMIRPALNRPNAYPCDSERNFATHCIYILGLKKRGKGKSAKNGKPVGYEVAKKLLKVRGPGPRATDHGATATGPGGAPEGGGPSGATC